MERKKVGKGRKMNVETDEKRRNYDNKREKCKMKQRQKK
jgi:hypothetical protein